MECQEAEDLLATYGACSEAFRLAVDDMVRVFSGSPAEFWSALKIAESALDDCHEARKAVDLHIARHQCQPD
jgi:hypothetical protein